MTGGKIGVFAEFAANAFPVLGREAEGLSIDRDGGIDHAGCEFGDEDRGVGMWIDTAHGGSGAWADGELLEEIDALGKLIGSVDEDFRPKKMVVKAEEGKYRLDAIIHRAFSPQFDFLGDDRHDGGKMMGKKRFAGWCAAALNGADGENVGVAVSRCGKGDEAIHPFFIRCLIK